MEVQPVSPAPALPRRLPPRHPSHPFKQGGTQGCVICGKRINDPIHSVSVSEPGKGQLIDVKV